MKNLFDASTADEVKGRVARLSEKSERQWGTMSAAQAMSHCSKSMEWAVGDSVPDKMFFAQILGRIIKNKVLGDDQPLRHNTPTAKSLKVTGDPQLQPEQARLESLLDRFASGGPAQCTKHPHSFFGPLTPEQWAILMYKHVDHHLRQFGV